MVWVFSGRPCKTPTDRTTTSPPFSRTETILSREADEADRAERHAEQERNAAKRAPVVLRPVESEPMSEAEVEAAAHAYREAHP